MISTTTRLATRAERTPQSLDGKATIALFGGSTTDVGGEGETWGDRLEELLGADRFAVNHGMLGYSTAEHVIQTAFYEQHPRRAAPRCAIYYVGWNDPRNSHARNLDPGYADFRVARYPTIRKPRRLRQPCLPFSPLPMLARYFLVLGVDTARPVDRPSGQYVSCGDRIRRWRRSSHAPCAPSSAINRQRGNATLPVGQVLTHRRLPR